MKGRWKVACINWSSPDAPHAAAYLVGPDGSAIFVCYFPIHAEAIAFADKHARKTADV